MLEESPGTPWNFREGTASSKGEKKKTGFDRLAERRREPFGQVTEEGKEWKRVPLRRETSSQFNKIWGGELYGQPKSNEGGNYE